MAWVAWSETLGVHVGFSGKRSYFSVKVFAIFLGAAVNIALYQNCSESQFKTMSDSSLGLPSSGSDITPPADTPPGDNPPPPSPIAGAPVILYTDVASGPRSGGENNQGIYLSIFGKNFGSSGLGSSIRVYIGGVEVGVYKGLGVSKARSDIQKITVQVGSLGNLPAGQPLGIQVVSSGVASNSDKTFLINPGNIYYVDPVSGNDATGVANDISKPFKTVQSSSLTSGLWGKLKAGDVVVFRAGTHTGQGFDQYYTRFWFSDRSSGKSPSGTSGTGPITFLGYPNEDAFINCAAATNPNGCLSGLNGSNYPNAGKWVVIAGLRIEGGGYDGPISQQVFGDNWRVINNEITAYTGVTTGSSASRMAGITGNGMNSVWLGNHIHDIQGSNNEAHGIYIDGDGSYDIGFNNIHDIKSGKGFQVYVNGGNGSTSASNINLHHNIIHDVTQFGINIADGTVDNILVTNNLVYNTTSGGLRFNTNTLKSCRVYNNTFYNTNMSKNSSNGALMSDWNLPSGSLDVRNNIIHPATGTSYLGGSVGVSTNTGTFSNNLWYNGNGTVTLDPAKIALNPLFIAPGTDFRLNDLSPAIDAGTSTVSTVVINDLILTARPGGNAYDVGAYEH